MDDINESQIESYFKFKELLLKEKIVEDFSKFNTQLLLSFLRARKFDLTLTLTMFKNYLSWYKEFKVDEIHLYKVPHINEVYQNYPRTYHKTDKFGRPIYIEMISMINIDKILDIIDEDGLVKMMVKDYEYYKKVRLPACSKAAGKAIEQSLTILCAKDCSLSFFLKVKKMIQKSSQISQDYYPEMLGNLFIINTNFVFKMMWKVIKLFLEEKTKSKIKIEGYDYLDNLKEFVELENLPSILGGYCKCEHVEGGCMYSDIGPWNPNFTSFESE